MEAGQGSGGRKYLYYTVMILLVVINKEKYYVTQTLIKFLQRFFNSKIIQQSNYKQKRQRLTCDFQKAGEVWAQGSVALLQSKMTLRVKQLLIKVYQTIRVQGMESKSMC